ncbi:MAG: phenylalanine--tRNA ligase subunit beta, partial [Alphaproteobacteria bacterium]
LTYSFIPQPHALHFAAAETLLELDNPLDASTMTTMRPSLLPGLLAACAANMHNNRPAERLAEVGTIFSKTAEGSHEQPQAAAVLANVGNRHWQGMEKVDAFTAKAMTLQVLESMGVALTGLTVKAPASATFHPGQSGQIVQGMTVLAEFGMVHPSTLKLFDLKVPAAALTVDIAAVHGLKLRDKPFTVSTYQPVARDLAFVLPEHILAQDVVKTILNATKPLAKAAEVFDVYQGKGIPEGKKSLAIALTLQADDRTLADADITDAMDKAIAAVAKYYGGELRA